MNLPGQFSRDGVIFPGYVRNDVKEAVRNFECREDDVFVVTYPKSGTTWAIELVSLIMNNADTEYNLSMVQMARVPVLELAVSFAQRVKWLVTLVSKLRKWLVPKFVRQYLEWQEYPELGALASSDAISYLKTLPSPRIIKSHLQYKFFPKQAMEKKCKIVYVARNAKDTLVSYYYFHTNNYFHGYNDKPWSEFFKIAMDKKLPYGDWFDHVIGWGKHKDEDNVCFMTYENMKKDPREVVYQLASFLNKELSEETVDKILEFCSFKNMKKNTTVNMELETVMFDVKRAPFMRKGIVGDWQNHFTVAENDEFEKLYERKMKESGLTFEW
ncbi:sulfotransferase 1B1-like [Glandiceps talaboti]